MKKKDVIAEFEDYLRRKGLSVNSIASYTSTVYYYLQKYKVTDKDLLAYKGDLVSNKKPRTVNLRIQALNNFLKFLGMTDLHLQSIKLQEQTYLENVISDADYRFLKRRLFADKNDDLGMAVWFMGATGARVSELLQFKAEHVKCGYIDISSKGGKVRRIFIPRHLANKALLWLQKKEITSGYIFLNHNQQRITPRGLSAKLHEAARKYHLNVAEVHPHSFRHRFAKNFLDKYHDIALLADLLGHDSIETTRIYLKRTSTEQQEIVNRVVDW